MRYLGYHASPQHFAPSELLRYVHLAENHGFNAIGSSAPIFSENNLQWPNGFSFAWLGAAMRNSSLPFALFSTTDHPQKPQIATQTITALEEMFPTRLTLALKSKDVLDGMPDGDNLSITQPDYKKGPLIFAEAVTAEAAARAGKWADGLVTTARPVAELNQVVDSFRNNGGENKPMYLKVQVAYEDSLEEALAGAYHYLQNSAVEANAFETAAVASSTLQSEPLVPADLFNNVRISEKLGQHADWINEDFELGFEKIFLHQVCTNQLQFIEDFGRSVLPKIKLRWNVHA